VGKQARCSREDLYKSCSAEDSEQDLYSVRKKSLQNVPFLFESIDTQVLKSHTFCMFVSKVDSFMHYAKKAGISNRLSHHAVQPPSNPQIQSNQARFHTQMPRPISESAKAKIRSFSSPMKRSSRWTAEILSTFCDPSAFHLLAE
jgi:hypothetical protein